MKPRKGENMKQYLNQDITFPHFTYIQEIQSLSTEERTLFYVGGETKENHSRLTVGKAYVLRTAAYSPSRDVDRISVWICSDDSNKGKVCRVDKKNFVTFTELRNRKIDSIIY
jgi:hypothetical protein